MDFSVMCETVDLSYLSRGHVSRGHLSRGEVVFHYSSCFVFISVLCAHFTVVSSFHFVFNFDYHHDLLCAKFLICLV